LPALDPDHSGTGAVPVNRAKASLPRNPVRYPNIGRLQNGLRASPSVLRLLYHLRVPAGDGLVGHLDHLCRGKRVVDAGARRVQQRRDRMTEQGVDTTTAQLQSFGQRHVSIGRRNIEDIRKQLVGVVANPRLRGFFQNPGVQPSSPGGRSRRIGGGPGVLDETCGVDRGTAVG
jgi:hypothetical protein